MKKTVLVLLALSQFSYSVIVHCPDQSESCQCPEHATECEFTFHIEERFSFVSYPFNPVDDGRGYLYHLNSNGYQPSSISRTRECFIEGAVHDADFTNNNCSVPMTLDGVNYRPLLLINNRIPGPTLVVYENQIIIVHVINNLQDIGISIHWHGMYQLGSAWMDGVGFVTQPPIDAGSSFDYIFKAQPSGTHWYHSHIGSQKSDGLFGGLVILERRRLGTILENSTYDNVINNPGQHTLTLIDWQRKPEAIEQALTDISFYPQLPIGVVPTNQDRPSSAHKSEDGASLGGFPFWSGLINGRGRKEATTPTPLSIFNVRRGSTYHFRLIGSISILAFRVSVDGHKLKAIASDGEYFEPVEVDYIIIHTGETYDFLLDANQHSGNFWIRAETLEVLPPGEEHSARAILTYENRNDFDWRKAYNDTVPERERDCSTPCKVLNCPFEDYFSPNLSCVPLTSLVGMTGTPESQVPRYPPNENCSDCNHFLNFAFDGEGRDSSINSRSFQFPSVDYASNCFLFDKEKNDNTSNTCNNFRVDPANTKDGGSRCTDVVPIANNVTYDPSGEPQSVTMVLSGINAHFAHPIHLHGHSFHVVYIGYSEYNMTTGKVIGFTDDIECNGENKLCVNPRWRHGTPQAVLNRTSGGRVVRSAIRKDTVIIPAGGYVVIAFQADNPGFWIMHCHIEEHLLNGMAIIVQEYSSDRQWAPPPGINLHGSFKWTVEEYRALLASGKTCGSQVPMPAFDITQQLAATCPSDAGIVVSMAVIAVLTTILAILIIG